MSAQGGDVVFDDAFLIVPDAPAPDTSALVNALNNVYIAETCSYFRYMETWSPYTNAKTIALRSAVRRMMRRSFEHGDILAHLIAKAGGVTEAGSFALDASGTNDTGWVHLLPRLIDTKLKMCARYEAVIAKINAMGPVGEGYGERLGTLLAENRDDLDELQAWHRRLDA